LRRGAVRGVGRNFRRLRSAVLSAAASVEGHCPAAAVTSNDLVARGLEVRPVLADLALLRARILGPVRRRARPGECARAADRDVAGGAGIVSGGAGGGRG